MNHVQRITLGLVGLGFLAATVFFTGLSQRVEYATVFSGLNQQDAGMLVEKLKEAKVPYELADGGATIKVPAGQVADVRLQLAAEGLPLGGGVGYELFDRGTFGLTDFAQQLDYRRALEGELARTINTLSAVEQSRVHIVIPKAELYTEREQPATASVVLKLRPGGELRPDQIRGISNLVAGSVEGLKPENVNIMDTDSNILSDLPDDSRSGSIARATSTQMAMTLDYQKSLETSAQALLDQVLGPGKATVRVNADLDWDQVELSSETFTPDGTVPQVRSSQETTERYGGSPDDIAGGIPGVSSNIPSYQGIAAVDASSTVTNTYAAGYERIDKIDNYELSKVVANTVKAPGDIKRLSVAVVLDAAVDAGQVENIENVVAAVVGLDNSRGDSITVASMPFDRTFQQEQAKLLDEANRWAMYFEIGKVLLGIIALVVVILFVRRLAHSLQPNTAKLDQKQRSQTPTIVVTRPELEEAQDKRELILGQVTALTKTQPAAVASLLKTWIEEK